MNGAQKATKYIGIFIGILLAIGILGAIIQGGLAILRIFTDGSAKGQDFSQSYTENIRNLHVQVGAGEVRLVQADGWKVEATNIHSGFRCQVTEDTLRIEEEWSFLKFFRLGGNDAPTITVYMPADQLSLITLHNGAGKLTADAVNAHTVKLDGGAGEFQIAAVKADRLEADLGVGEVSIQDAEVGDLDIDGGVGAFAFAGRLTGNANIDGGVGEVRMTLIGSSREDFNYNLDHGVGEIRIGGQRGSAGKTTYPGASQTLDIDGGVGEVTVDFTDE